MCVTHLCQRYLTSSKLDSVDDKTWDFYLSFGLFRQVMLYKFYVFKYLFLLVANFDDWNTQIIIVAVAIVQFFNNNMRVQARQLTYAFTLRYFIREFQNNEWLWILGYLRFFRGFTKDPFINRKEYFIQILKKIISHIYK